jgi:hypothetical protein
MLRALSKHPELKTGAFRTWFWRQPRADHGNRDGAQEAASLRQLPMQDLPDDSASRIGKFFGNAIAALIYLGVLALVIVAVLR